MRKKGERPFRICGAYDTETTTMETGRGLQAFACLYICNDLSRVDLADYEPGKGEIITFHRTADGFLAWIDGQVFQGQEEGYIPVIAAYNLMFDLKTVLFELGQVYTMEACAQSSSNVYYIDLKLEDKTVLRFWDTFNLELNGLAVMGQVCGFTKGNRTGNDWDYTLIRSDRTPLTESEEEYARRDVQVIPAYLRYLLEANPNLKPEDLGCRVLTKTSLVRRFAEAELGHLRIKTKRGKSTLGKEYVALCTRERADNYGTYGLRKACFRGGFTLTAAAYASTLQRNVASVDVTSMHHTFINGRRCPQRFRDMAPEGLQRVAEKILATSREEVLSWYNMPFTWAMHAQVAFTNLRLRSGSVFERDGIALLARGKFSIIAQIMGYSQRELLTESGVRKYGFLDYAEDPTFAFGKLYASPYAVIYVNELELWSMSRVYEWDSMEVLFGEATPNWQTPPDYVTLQSHLLYKRKSDMKGLLKRYEEGTPYKDVPKSLPAGIAASVADGSASRQFLESYYGSTVKGMFNGIYGVLAQDVMKPDWLVEGGELAVDRQTVADVDNFAERMPKTDKVLYTFGMRIVGGSRLHLVLAMEMIFEYFGDRVKILGGDTDSLKLACADDVEDSEIDQALAPLHRVSQRAIRETSARASRLFADMCPPMDDVGGFEIEDCGGSTRYVEHIELWNKARVSLDAKGKVHVTCAGLSRPEGSYTIENWIEDAMTAGLDFATAADLALGYNVCVENSVCHSLGRDHPKASDLIDVTGHDHLGNYFEMLDVHPAIALYSQDRELGELDKRSNIENVVYLENKYGRRPNCIPRKIWEEDGRPKAMTLSMIEGCREVL